MTRRDLERPLVVFVLVFAAYLGGPIDPGNRDNWPAQLATESLLAGRGFDLSPYYVVPPPAAAYEVRESAGRIVSNFPQLHAVAALPAALATRILFPDLDPASRSRRTGRAAGALFAAAAVGGALRVVRRLTRADRALVIGLCAAFASPLMSVASRELWTHGPAALAVAVAAAAALRPGPARLACAGIAVAALAFVRPAALLPVLVLLAAALFRRRAPGASWWFFGAGAAAAAAVQLAVMLLATGAPVGVYQRIHLSSTASWRLPQLQVAAAYLISPARGLFLFAPLAIAALAGFARVLRRRGATGAVRSPLRALAWGCAAALLAALLEVSCFRHWWGGIAIGPRLLSEYIPLLMVLAALAPPRWLAASALLSLPVGLFHAGQAYLPVANWDALRGIDRRPGAVWDVADSPWSAFFVGLPAPSRDALASRDLLLPAGTHAVGLGEHKWFVHGWAPPEAEGLWAAVDAEWHVKESWLAFRLPQPGRYTLEFEASAPAKDGRRQSLEIEVPGEARPLERRFTRELWEFEWLSVPVRYTPGVLVVKLRPRHLWSPGSGDWRRCAFFVRAVRLTRHPDD